MCACPLQSGVVGAKANNLAKLRSSLPEWVRVPASVALPFGVFEAVMDQPDNAGPAAQLKQLQAELNNARVRRGCVWELRGYRRRTRSGREGQSQNEKEMGGTMMDRLSEKGMRGKRVCGAANKRQGGREEGREGRVT